MKKPFFVMCMLAVSMMVGAGNPYKKYTQNLPFDMPEVSAPQIPEHEVSLSDDKSQLTLTSKGEVYVYKKQ